MKYAIIFFILSVFTPAHATTLNYALTEQTYVIFYPDAQTSPVFHTSQIWNCIGTAKLDTDIGYLEWTSAGLPQHQTDPWDDNLFSKELIEKTSMFIDWTNLTANNGNINTNDDNYLLSDFSNDEKKLPLAYYDYTFNLKVTDFNIINLLAGYVGFTHNGSYETGTKICLEQVATPEPKTLLLSLLGVYLFTIRKDKLATC